MLAASARLIQLITHPHLNPPPSKGEEIERFSSPFSRGGMCGFRKRWIPAFAGMTYREAGMTYREAGMTWDARMTINYLATINPPYYLKHHRLNDTLPIRP
jgi:hypothetical protein